MAAGEIGAHLQFGLVDYVLNQSIEVRRRNLDRGISAQLTDCVIVRHPEHALGEAVLKARDAIRPGQPTGDDFGPRKREWRKPLIRPQLDRLRTAQKKPLPPHHATGQPVRLGLSLAEW